MEFCFRKKGGVPLLILFQRTCIERLFLELTTSEMQIYEKVPTRLSKTDVSVMETCTVYSILCGI